MSTTTSAAARTESEFNLLDLLKYLLSKWPWFVVSLAVCCTFAWYKGATAPLVYYSSAKVIIKDPSNKTSSAGLDRYDRSINKVNVANEILQFRSKQLMQQVVSRVHADVVYTTRQGLRDVNVFGETPFTVTFLNLKPNDRFAMEFEPVSANEVELTSINGKGTKAMRMRTGVPYTVNGVKLMFTPTGKWSSKWEGALITVNKYTVNSMVGYWLGNLGIRQEDEEATILNIAIKSPSRELGAEMLTTLINVYNEESINDKNRVAVNTADFINERLRIIEAELGGVENDLESYKSRNQIVDIGSTASRYMGESARYNADALQFETQMRIALYIKEYLTDPSRSVDLIPSNIGINDAAIESQISQYNALKLQRDKLADDSSEANPVVAEMSATLNTLRTNILRAVDNIIQSINVKRRDAKGYEAQAESRVASIPRKEREMLSIERQQKIKEELYLFLLNRREENALAQAMADNNARIIDDPEDSGTLISPDRVRLMLLGFAVGLMIPTVILLMLRFLDTRVQGRRDVKNAVTVPFLGEIPMDKNAKNKRHSKDEGENRIYTPGSLAGEAFRVLRTNIDFMTRKAGAASQILMLTSFNEGAGKTYTSTHLAEVLSSSGKKVALVDLDIRKATLTARFSIEHHHKGVTDYITDTGISVDDVTVPTPGGHDVVPAGSLPPNPVELLMDSRLDELMNELRSRYDYVIVDSVPVGVVADASIASRIADLTMFVVRAGKLDKRQLPDLQALYDERKLGNMGIVLNGVSLRSHGYGYGYGYGYVKGKKHKHRRRTE